MRDTADIDAFSYPVSSTQTSVLRTHLITIIMSRRSEAAGRGGELVDVDWHSLPAASVQSTHINEATPAAHSPVSTQRPQYTREGSIASRTGRNIASSSTASSHSKPNSSRATKPLTASSSMPSSSVLPSSAASSWLHQEPVTIGADKGSDRPLYCMSVSERVGSFVVGGADHSLRVYDLASCRLRRELYSKTSGHTEWVTCVAAMEDGRCVSGAMDSKCVLWPSSGNRGIDMLGHSASVSQVLVDSRDVAVSASYDKTLRVWSVSGMRPTCLSTLRGAGAALTALAWHQSLLVSGSREGQVNLWDIHRDMPLATLKPIASGQVLTVQLGCVETGQMADPRKPQSEGQEWILATGGADGHLRLFDLRSEQCIYDKRLSTGRPGSVTSVAFSVGRVIVGLSDGHCCVLDARSGFESVAHLLGHQAPVQCVNVPPGQPNVVCSAASNGWMTVHDLDGASSNGNVHSTSGKNRPIGIDATYAVGLTTQGGVNAMWCGESALVAACDDGLPVILRYV